MSKKSYHFIHLHPEAKEQRWKSLNRFFHPGSLTHDDQATIVGTNLNLSHHAFIYIEAIQFKDRGTKPVHIPYSLVASILEVVSHETVVGFIDPSKPLEE
jgi:hypothetical protein